MAFARLRIVLILLVSLAFAGPQQAQTNMPSPWTAIHESEALTRHARYIIPEDYQVYQLDKAALDGMLSEPPYGEKQDVSLILPLPVNGQMVSFKIKEDPVTEKALLTKYPELMTYSGYAINQPAVKVRLDFHRLGFHAMIRQPKKGFTFIDPYSPQKTDTYIVYEAKNIRPDEVFHCLTETAKEKMHAPVSRNNTVGDELRSFRIAIATTGEYTEFHGGTVTSGLSAVVTTLNRVNMIYETEAATRFILIGNNDQLIYTDAATDPYSNFDLSAMLGENQANIQSVIGSQNYDIGHVFGTSGGGVANVGVACKATEKSRGATGLSFPVGDVFDVAYVCHELGHQLNAVHTFNSCAGAGGWPNGYEPGSGTTIMAYAGLCGPDNVQIETDYFFHSSSFDRIVSWGNNCATFEPSGNNPPDVQIDVDPNLTLPVSTPFVLTGSGTDPDGDDLVFSWEEMDVGPLMPLGEASGNSPLFRFFPPVEEPERVFPRMDNLITNTNDPAELLPFYERSMNFRLVARDMQMGGGGVSYGEITLNVTGDAGPFQVMTPAPGDTWTTFELVTVEWDVANTDQAPVNCQSVNILLSTDGGYTYDYVLAESVPNTGSVQVEVPDAVGDENRIKVEAADHIFFDITDQNFAIEKTNINPSFTLINTPNPVYVCEDELAEVEILAQSIAGFDESIDLEIVTFPGGTTYNFDKTTLQPGEKATLVLDVTNLSGGIYEFIIEGTSPSGIVFSETIEVILTLRTTAISPLQPSPVAFEQPVNTLLKWLPQGGADNYEYQLSKTPDFSDIAVDGIIDDFELTIENLDGSTVYFWRVRGLNTCGAGAWSPVSAFHTAPLDCNRYTPGDIPKDIDDGAPNTVISNVQVPDDFAIQDVNIRTIRIIHDDIGELEVFLKAPDNTQTTLLEVICPGLDAIALDLDDEADNISLPCPPTTGEAYLPRERLNEHDGHGSAGTWSLIVVDNVNGNGGLLNEWVLELCADQSPNYSPYLINNKPVQLFSGEMKVISSAELRASSIGSTDGDMIYVLQNNPTDGTLMLGGTPIQPGSGFRQTDINAGLLAYQHESGNENDSFTFSVFNGEGAYIKDQVFSVELLFNSLSATIEKVSEISCFDAKDGVVRANTSGGYPPLTYSLNGGPFNNSAEFSGLGPGDYQITVRDNQDFTLTTGTVSLANPPQLIVVAEQDGNNIEASASGGTGSYEFSLNGGSFQSENTFVDPGPGMHTIRVRDSNGCIAQDEITLTSTPLSAIAILYNGISCHGANDATIEVIANGGVPPYEYSLNGIDFQNSPVFENLGPSNYILLLRDALGNSRFTNGVEVTDPPPIQIMVNINMNDVEIIAQGGTGELTYSLDSMTFQEDPHFTDLPEGDYTAYVQDENGCVKSTDFFIMTTSTEGSEKNYSWTLFPNPADHYLVSSCKGCGNPETMVIYNGLGKKIRTLSPVNKEVQHIPLTGITPGFYVLELQFDGYQLRKPFIRK